MTLNKKWISFSMALFAMVTPQLRGQSASSGVSTLDAGGGESSSSDYAAIDSIGGFGGIAESESPDEARVQHGHIGQLLDVVSIEVDAEPDAIDEEVTEQITATAVATMDDQTTIYLGGGDLLWRVGSGPVAAITPSGMLTAANVYQDTPAVVVAAFLGVEDDYGLTIRNVGDDDFGLYAADGVPDPWQVENFGEENPDGVGNMDPDGDLQDNRFEQLARLDPLDPLSRMKIEISSVEGEPNWRAISIMPYFGGRGYSIESNTDLTTGEWTEVRFDPQAIDGDKVTFTDKEADAPEKFYRARIGRP